MEKKYVLYCFCGKDEWTEEFKSLEELQEKATFLEAEGVDTVFINKEE